jgi:hypothetical protein
MFRTMARHVPPPAGVRSPLEWGTEARLTEMLGDGVADLVVRPRTYTFRFRSPDDFVDVFRVNYGPVHVGFSKLDAAGQDALAADLAALAAEHARPQATGIALASEYLEVIATRRIA